MVQGRMADPARSTEMVMSAGAAAEEGLRIGSALRLAFFTTAQVNSSSFAGYPADKPYLVIALKLVGIVEDNAQIVQDDDAALGNQLAVITPALTRRLESCCAYYSYVSLQLDGGTRHEPAVLSAIRKITPDLGQAGGSQTSAPAGGEGGADHPARGHRLRGIRAHHVPRCAGDQRSGGQPSGAPQRRGRRGPAGAGAGPAMSICDGLIGVVGAVLAGAVLAVAVAVGLSPLAPIGPVRPVYPDRGVAFDGLVLGLGFVLLVVVLSGSAVAVAYRASAHRASRARGDAGRGSSRPRRPPPAACRPPR